MTSEGDHPEPPRGEEEQEIGELIGRLSGTEELDKTTRGRLIGRLAHLLASSAKGAGVRGLAGGKWLADTFAAVAPRIPIRDLETLRAHYPGLSAEALADELVRGAVNRTTAVGAAGGALAAVQFTAPPLLLTAPAQIVAETLVVAAIETKMIAELHEAHGVQIQGGTAERTMTYAVAWAKQRGVNPMDSGSLSVGLGGAAKAALRKRMMGVLGRHMTTLGPFLTGAVAGGTLNRAATKKLAEKVRNDLARYGTLARGVPREPKPHHLLGGGHAQIPPPGPPPQDLPPPGPPPQD
ncbi:hypothetical protein [Actinocorallia sp. A-T 12471]|uniref:hypothetical protein n=1 Tax=Actinocorallia sp. A-T 12471 TaxID=3089813 RepID=UPI0029D278D1|nr:hypothetical protein [Actinocorallia sp. A-T 12471]MDX6739755.1 hypothetical protein [Actinocorallia sp. A-T 12471]